MGVEVFRRKGKKWETCSVPYEVKEEDELRLVVATDSEPQFFLYHHELETRLLSDVNGVKRWHADFKVEYWAGILLVGVEIADVQEWFGEIRVDPPDLKLRRGRETFLHMVEAVARFDASLPWGFTPARFKGRPCDMLPTLPMRASLAVSLGATIAAAARKLADNPPAEWDKRSRITGPGARLSTAHGQKIVRQSRKLAVAVQSARKDSAGTIPLSSAHMPMATPVPHRALSIVAAQLAVAAAFIRNTAQEMRMLPVKKGNPIKTYQAAMIRKLDKIAADLRDVLNRPPFASVAPAPQGGGAIPDRTGDAQVDLILRTVRTMTTCGISLEAPASPEEEPAEVTVALRPSFDLFELYCLSWCVQQIKYCLGPEWQLQRPAINGQGVSIGTTVFTWSKPDDPHSSVELVFQQDFQSIRDNDGVLPLVGSLSAKRIPDFVVIAKPGGQAARWGIFDAKFRSHLQAIHESLQAIHAYRDALRWDDTTTSSAVILVPNMEDKAKIYASSDYLARHDFGVIVVEPVRHIQADGMAQRFLAKLLEPVLGK